MDTRVTELVLSSIDEVNRQLPKDELVEKTMDAVLFGDSGRLDSLGIINLIMTIEQKIQKEFGKTVSLANDKAMSQTDSPFKTVRSLSEYISDLLKEDAP